MLIEPVIIEINRPNYGEGSSGSNTNQGTVREESFEESGDFFASSSSSGRRVVRLRDLDDDLTDMIAEAYEATR